MACHESYAHAATCSRYSVGHQKEEGLPGDTAALKHLTGNATGSFRGLGMGSQQYLFKFSRRDFVPGTHKFKERHVGGLVD